MFYFCPISTKKRSQQVSATIWNTKFHENPSSLSRDVPCVMTVATDFKTRLGMEKMQLHNTSTHSGKQYGRLTSGGEEGWAHIMQERAVQPAHVMRTISAEFNVHAGNIKFNTQNIKSTRIIIYNFIRVYLYIRSETRGKF
jgi:hypothetical protein